MTDRRAPRLPYRWWWYAASVGIVLLIGAGYLLAPSHCARSGYPLDDAWIHQCYARTLAQTGQLAFAPGQPSTGSTSLLWTFLLTLGRWMRLPPVPWSYALGALAWFLAAWTVQNLADHLFPWQQPAVPWVALACLLEWHLAWAALSGMEITLFCFLSLLLLERHAARAHPLGLGLIGGLLVWARPEGLALVALVLVSDLLSWATALLQPAHTDAPDPRSTHGTRNTQPSRLLLLAAALALSLLPYLLLNLSISGQLFPSTLYAKQTEYRILLDQPLGRRLWVVVRRPLVGAQVLLLPGFVWQTCVTLRQTLRSIRSTRARSGIDVRAPFPMGALLPLIWWAAHHSLYALRLPVDYQHGRYLIPAFPILLAYGITGTLHWLLQTASGPGGGRPFTRIWTRALVAALSVLVVAFLLLGAQAYVQDRCIIHQEMVTVALWLRDNTPPDARIAAHDIGAIGYWAERPLLDLAGLVNPQVIPILRDERRLLEYVLAWQADYLVTFPSWYPTWMHNDRLIQVYPKSPPGTSPGQQEPMTVYQIEP